MANKSLARLMVMIHEGYVFDTKTYPDLNDANEFRFGINHSVLHIMKSMGIMAAQLEKADHGGQMDDNQLRELTLKQLVNVLKLSCHLGITASEIEQHIVAQYGDK